MGGAEVVEFVGEGDKMHIGGGLAHLLDVAFLAISKRHKIESCNVIKTGKVR